MDFFVNKSIKFLELLHFIHGKRILNIQIALIGSLDALSRSCNFSLDRGWDRSEKTFYRSFIIFNSFVPFKPFKPCKYDSSNSVTVNDLNTVCLNVYNISSTTLQRMTT